VPKEVIRKKALPGPWANPQFLPKKKEGLVGNKELSGLQRSQLTQ